MDELKHSIYQQVGNSNRIGWGKGSGGVYLAPVQAVVKKTSEEFQEMDVDNMSEEELKRELNNTLVALEEAQEAWKELVKERNELRETVQKLRDAGFTGSEAPVPEKDQDEVSPWVLNPDGGIETRYDELQRLVDQYMRKSSRL